MEIKNTPPYAADYRFIVYRICDGERWFWGAWNDGGKAAQAAAEIGGLVWDKEAQKDE
jgi:hypothetical protein